MDTQNAVGPYSTKEKPSDWLSVKEAALIWNILPNSMRKTIITHRHLISEHVKGGGTQGKYLAITKSGLFQLQNIVNIPSRSDSESYQLKQQVAQKASTESPNYKQAISDLAMVVKQLTEEMKELKMGKQAHELSNMLLPEPTKEVPEMSTRMGLNKFVRDTAKKANRHYQIIFNELYSQFYYRYRINITQRAAKQGMSMIEYAEQYGHIEDLYALARKIYG